MTTCLFIVVLAFVGLAARAISHWAGERRWRVALAVATAILMVAPTELCRLTGSMTTSTWILGALSAVFVALRYRSLAATIRPLHVERAPIAIGAVALFLIAFVAFHLSDVWDESALHFGLSSVLSGGIVPPV